MLGAGSIAQEKLGGIQDRKGQGGQPGQVEEGSRKDPLDRSAITGEGQGSGRQPCRQG